MAKSLVVCNQCAKEFLKENGRINKNGNYFCCVNCYLYFRRGYSLDSEIGKKYGGLIIISLAKSVKNRTYVNCLCDCGKEKVFRLNALKTGNTKSCGNCRGYTVEERFMSYIDIVNDNTWLWTGSVNEDGYGQFRYKGKSERAHRISYELFIGEIPKGMCICHKYDDTPTNICPKNLWLGTHQQNMKDMKNKGRARGLKGEECNMSKLNNEKVKDIRSLYATGGYKMQELADMFGVWKGTIGKIITCQTWKEVEEPFDPS